VKRLLPVLAALAVGFSSLTSGVVAATTIKAGATCSKFGSTFTAQASIFECVKFGKKLVWKRMGSSASKVATSSPSGQAVPVVRVSISDVRQLSVTALNSKNPQPTLDQNSTVAIESDNQVVFKNLSVVSRSGLFTVFGPDPLTIHGADSTVGWGMFDHSSQNGVFKSLSALPPWGTSFNFTTSDPRGRFEVLTSNFLVPGAGYPYSTRSWRLAYKKDGDVWHYLSIGGVEHPTDGRTYSDLVSMSSSGHYQIRLEFEAGTVFWGISLPDNSSHISALPIPPTPRVVIVGDSFTHPTLGEKGPYTDWDGYPMILSWLTGWNVISEGVNGQGLVNPSAGETFGDRVVRDVLPQHPQIVIIVASTNDYCPNCTFSSGQISAALDEDIKKLKAADPNTLIIVSTSFIGNPSWTQTLKAVTESNGIPLLDFLSQPLIDMSQANNPYVNGHPTREGGLHIATGILQALASL
jgi:GDSL-like Lipase/Acylhydrolase family